MAVTLEELKELGITDDQAKALLEKIGGDGKNDNMIPKSRFDEVVKERNEARELNSQITKKLEDLEKGNEDIETLKKSIETLKEDNLKAQKDFDAKVKDMTISHAIENSLRDANAINASVVKPLFDIEKIKIEKDGSVSGIKEQLDELVRGETTSFLFKGAEPTNNQNINGAVPGKSNGKENGNTKPESEWTYDDWVNFYENQNKADFIVIHETDNIYHEAGANKHGEAHKNGNLKTSVHYYVDDTYIVQTLDHDDAAWAVGTVYGNPNVKGVNNKNTINIEICVNPDSDYTKARLKCVELVKYLMKKTNISADHVIRHYDEKKKYCPRKMLDNPTLWEDFKKRIREEDTGGKTEVKTMVTYLGDADLYAAVVVAQKNKAPLMKVADFKASGIKADKVIQICGNEADTDRYATFKNAAKLL